MKPFLLLAIRAEDAAADNEYDSVLAYWNAGFIPRGAGLTLMAHSGLS